MSPSTPLPTWRRPVSLRFAPPPRRVPFSLAIITSLNMFAQIGWFVFGFGSIFWGYLVGQHRVEVDRVELPLPGLPDALAGLRMAQISAFQAFVREVGEVDLPPGRFALLTLIGRNPGISQTVLSRAAGRDKSTLTPALQDLKRRGLIARVRLESDRRSYHLTLTPAGEAMLVRLTECAARHERNLDRVIGARDRARFLSTLRKVMSDLD